MPVSAGDVISVSTNHPESQMTVTWSQSFSTRTQKYYALTYFKTSRANEGEHDGAIFVQADMWDYLKGRCNVKGDVMEIKVDAEFQYGQRKDGTRRFLVFHNREQKPYQHRFIETALGSKALSGMEGVLKSTGYDQTFHTDQIADLAKSFIGDYLHQM